MLLVASCKKNAGRQDAHRRFSGLFVGMRGARGGRVTRRKFAGALLVGQLNFASRTLSTSLSFLKYHRAQKF